MLRALILLVYFTYIVNTLPSLPEHDFSKTVQDGTKTIIINGVKTKTTVKKVFVKLKEGSYVYRKKDPLYTLYKRNSCKNTKLLRKRIYCFVETLQTPLIKLSLRVVNERKL